MSTQQHTPSIPAPPDSLSELESAARHRRSVAARPGASIPPKFQRKRISGARVDAYAQLMATPSVAPAPLPEVVNEPSLAPTSVPSPPQPGLPQTAEPRRRSPRMLIALALGLTLGVGATVLLQQKAMEGANSQAAAPAAAPESVKADEAKPAARAEQPARSDAPTATQTDDDAEQPAEAATAAGPMPAVATIAPADENAPADETETAAADESGDAKADDAETADEEEAAAAAGPVAFDEGAARAAVNAAAGAASGCTDGETKGSALVSITFANSGRATIAMIDGGSRLAGTPVGSCVARTMRTASVPAYDGPVVTVRSTVRVR